MMWIKLKRSCTTDENSTPTGQTWREPVGQMFLAGSVVKLLDNRFTGVWTLAIVACQRNRYRIASLLSDILSLLCHM